MSTAHTYARGSRQEGGGRWIGGYTTTCTICEGPGFVSAGNQSGNLPPEVVTKAFQRKGWRITKKHRVCPECITKEQEQTNVAKHDLRESTNTDFAQTRSDLREHPKDQPIPMLQPVRADPPRQLTRDARRTITRAIDDVWSEEKGCYLLGNTDGLIASALGVPRAWVEQVRQETFGDTGRNENYDKAIGELRNLKGQADRAGAEALQLAEKFETLSRNISSVLTNLKEA